MSVRKPLKAWEASKTELNSLNTHGKHKFNHNNFVRFNKTKYNFDNR